MLQPLASWSIAVSNDKAQLVIFMMMSSHIINFKYKKIPFSLYYAPQMLLFGAGLRIFDLGVPVNDEIRFERLIQVFMNGRHKSKK